MNVQFYFKIKSPDKYESKYHITETELFKTELDILQQFCNVYGCTTDTEPSFNFDEDEIYYDNGNYSFTTNVCFVCAVSNMMFVSHAIRSFVYYHKYQIVDEWLKPDEAAYEKFFE